MQLAFDLAISLLGIYPEDIAPRIRKYMYTSLFIAALFAIANTGNDLNAHTPEMVEPSPGHPYRVEKNVTVKNTEDEFY